MRRGTSSFGSYVDPGTAFDKETLDWQHREDHERRILEIERGDHERRILEIERRLPDP